MTETNWTDLETRGFIHIPRFLSEDEVTSLQRIYESSNKNDWMGRETIKEKCSAIVAAVTKETSTQVDFVMGGAYFSAKSGANFGWHQDHESYYYTQDHLNYLNFYIPIIKPARESTNVSLLPFDRMRQYSPEFLVSRRGLGAARLRKYFNKWFLIDDWSNGIRVLSFDVEKMVETPLLAEGDLLLLRGDMFHCTQDTETHRVSLSIRMLNTQSILSLKKFTHFSFVKVYMMARRRGLFDNILRCFIDAGKSQMTVGEAFQLMEVRKKQSGVTKSSVPAFLFRLGKCWLRCRWSRY